MSTRSAQRLREAALAALESALETDLSRALQLAEAAFQQDPSADSAYVLALALSETDDLDRALDLLRGAITEDPLHGEAMALLADLFFQTIDFEGSLLAMQAAMELLPLDAQLHTLRAWLRERDGDFTGAARDYATAADLDPDRYPPPTMWSEAMLEAAITAALEGLHDSLQAYLSGVTILVEDVPPEDVLLTYEPLSVPHPAWLMGSFTGPLLPDEGVESSWSWLPPTIRLFRCNLGRDAHSEEALQAEIQETILEEIGRFLGIDAEELAARGLE